MNNEQQQLRVAQMAKAVRENMPAQLELARLFAQITREKYVALVDVGFTEQQALDLCKEWKG